MKAYRLSPATLPRLSPQSRHISPLNSNNDFHGLRSSIRQPTTTIKRSFISNPFSSGVQTLAATRTVSYPCSLIYSVVSDVSSYSAFLPFCKRSTVTKHSSPDKNGKTWPEEAELVVGLSDDVSETFTSRVYCSPETCVEAVSGETNTSLKSDAIAHHSPRGDTSEAARDTAVLTHLLTRWTLRPFPFKPAPNESGESKEPAREQTEVNLAIEFQFANPAYGVMSKAAAPKVAEYMMEAFEKRVKALAGESSAGGEDGKVGSLEGVLRSRGDSP